MIQRGALRGPPPEDAYPKLPGGEGTKFEGQDTASLHFGSCWSAVGASLTEAARGACRAVLSNWTGKLFPKVPRQQHCGVVCSIRYMQRGGIYGAAVARTMREDELVYVVFLIMFLIQFLVVLAALTFTVFLAHPEVPFSRRRLLEWLRALLRLR